jgi:hypothetical protein
MNSHVPNPKDDLELAREIIRLVSRCLKDIDQHVMTIGTALDQGRIPPRIAMELVEQSAPGCIGKVHWALFENVSPDQLGAILSEVQ